MIQLEENESPTEWESHTLSEKNLKSRGSCVSMRVKKIDI